jgi:hypothetical protein
MSIFSEAARVGAEMEAAGQSGKGQLNVYACTPSLAGSGFKIKGGCGYWIVTIDRAAGVTPMFVKCGHCGGTATSRMYKVGDGLEPTHEWIRPKSEAELPIGYSLASVADHLKNGGLLLRPIGEGDWLEPTPATRAFVEQEQRMFERMGSGKR